jgi:hypothetical protein
VVPPGTKVHFHGVRDGAGEVRLYGVAHLTRSYEAAELDAAFEEAGTALNSMGRPMRTESASEEKACLYMPGWIAPVLMILEKEEDTLQMSAHTARSPIIGKLRCHIALWMLERRLPAGVIRIQEEKTKGRKKEEKHVEIAPKAEKKAESPKKKKYVPKRLKNYHCWQPQ